MQTRSRARAVPAALTFAALALLVSGCIAPAMHASRAEDFRLLLADGPAPARGAGRLVVTFFETGLGDASLVELPDGRAFLVDAGIGWHVDHILRYLDVRGIERLDGIVLTHPHLDHYGGIAEVVSNVETAALYHNGVRGSLGAWRDTEATLAARGVRSIVVRRGDELAALAGPGTGVSIEVLYPDDPASARGAVENKNRGSVVFRLTHGAHRFLFLGDSEWSEEDRLLAIEGPGGGLAADVLKLGHHASPLSGGEAFLRAVRPRFAVAMGTEVANVPLFWPKPNRRIRRVLRDLGTRTFLTGEEGAVQIVSYGRDLRVQTLEQALARRPARP